MAADIYCMKNMAKKHNKDVKLEISSSGDVINNDEILCLHDVQLSYINKIKKSCLNTCTLQNLKRRLPFIEWVPKYNIEDFKGDLIAGITIALTVIPQGLAYALLAGLPPQYGLYTAFMGCFMYTLFGSCKNLTVGPTAIMSIMTYEHATTGGITYVILVTFLAGCIQLILGILNLGFLVTFISSSVVSGFTSAAAITIAATQLSGIFGIKSKSEGFISDIINFVNGLKNGQINYWDMTMGFACILFLIIFKYIGNKNVSFPLHEQLKRILQILLKTLSTARNALLVLLCSGIVAILLSNNINGLTLTQKVKPGLPSFAFPKFSYEYFDNSTNQTIHKNFIEIVQELGSGSIIIALIGILEAVAVAKAFAKGKRLDATQEMIAIGICNIMGSFVSSYPTTGSFSRTAINYSSGVRTTAGGLVTGSLVLLALGVMSPYFQYIPKSSLSAMVFMAVLNMVHYQDVVVIWKTNKLDFLPFFTTFIFSFILGLEYGIIIGIITSLCLLLFQEAKPNILFEDKKTSQGHSFLYVKPDRTILFPSAEYLHSKILKAIPDDFHMNSYAIVFNGECLNTADYTLAVMIMNLIKALKDENIYLIFTNLMANVTKAIKGTNPEEFLCFLSQEDAENYIDALFMKEAYLPAYSEENSSTNLKCDFENSLNSL